MPCSVVPAEGHLVGIRGDGLVCIPDGINLTVKRRQVVTHNLQAGRGQLNAACWFVPNKNSKGITHNLQGCQACSTSAQPISHRHASTRSGVCLLQYAVPGKIVTYTPPPVKQKLFSP